MSGPESIKVFGLSGSVDQMPVCHFLNEVINERHENHIEIARRHRGDFEGIMLCFRGGFCCLYSKTQLFQT